MNNQTKEKMQDPIDPVLARSNAAKDWGNPVAASTSRAASSRVFHVVLIKPSHYDDDGYVIQWMSSGVPSNTLATLYGLALDCAQRRVLGDDVDIQISAYDETNTRIKIKKIARQMRARNHRGLVCLVGVQTNQYPRAMDIARSLRAAGVQVCIGGFHVSGSIAMLPDLAPELQAALDLGITLFAGEAEGRLAGLLRDADANQLQPLYNFMDDLPSLEGAPVPHLPLELIHRTRGMRTSFDAGRGCPFLCSFCTIINVQGRKSRSRSADDVERIIRANLDQGVHNFFITDDNLARNQHWEAIFDRLIEMREKQKLRIYIVAQVDMMCHKIRGFIEKAQRAGINRVFLGLENINPDALQQASKGQNRITEYREMLQAWHRVGVLTFAGYILGFPNDTPASIERDIEIIQRELPIDILEFFILTPLPGSADHKKLFLAGVEMDTDLNKYDVAHVATRHPRMTDDELLGIYQRAWNLFYSPQHVETVLRRSKMSGYDPRNMMMKLFSFEAPACIERIHPLESGVFRRKYRRDRRSDLPRENPLGFYAKFVWEVATKAVRYARLYVRYRVILRRVVRDSKPYIDVAVAPIQDNEFEHLDLYHTTRGSKTLVDKARRRKKLESKSASGALE